MDSIDSDPCQYLLAMDFNNTVVNATEKLCYFESGFTGIVRDCCRLHLDCKDEKLRSIQCNLIDYKIISPVNTEALYFIGGFFTFLFIIIPFLYCIYSGCCCYCCCSSYSSYFYNKNKNNYNNEIELNFKTKNEDCSISSFQYTSVIPVIKEGEEFKEFSKSYSASSDSLSFYLESDPLKDFI